MNFFGQNEVKKGVILGFWVGVDFVKRGEKERLEYREKNIEN